MMGILQLCGYGIALGERTVFDSLDLEIPGKGVSVILGPQAPCKSILLRTLAGFTAGNPSIRTWGQALYQNIPLATSLQRPALVVQNAPLLVSSVAKSLISSLPNRMMLARDEQINMLARVTGELGQEWIMAKANSQVIHLSCPEQKILAIVRETLANPGLLMLDEPTANLDSRGSGMVMSLIRRMAMHRPLLLVSQHPTLIQQLADPVALTLEGRVREVSPATAFFRLPVS